MLSPINTRLLSSSPMQIMDGAKDDTSDRNSIGGVVSTSSGGGGGSDAAATLTSVMVMSSVEYTDSVIADLAGAHEVLACLGDDVLEELLDEIVQTQMLPYDRIGRRGGTIGSLSTEHMERRWTGETRERAGEFLKF